MPHLLIVDADPDCGSQLRALAHEEGYTCAIAPTLTQASLQLALQQPDLLLISLELPEGGGFALAERCDAGQVPVWVPMTAQPSVDSVIQAWRLGAADYFSKPLESARVRQLLRQCQPSQAAAVASEPALSAGPVLIGGSAVMRTLCDHLARVAPTDASVLLLGESGTGKELVAQRIHVLSRRQRQPFLPVNCGAISPQLIESELFGHEKGSFTGADRQHKGYFERASGGTLFLDEVLEMPIELQVKLLRVLETGTFMRIGSNQELRTDVRIVAATNRDPEAAIAEGRLRLDLYHRLNVFPLRIPSLRERGDDVQLLAQHFLDELNAAQGTCKRFSPGMLAALAAHDWPGNVRELRNVIQRAYILSDEQIDAGLPVASITTPGTGALTLAIPVGSSLAEVDRRLIFATLELCGGVKKRTADVLGISLKTLYNRLEEYHRAETSTGLREPPPRVANGIALPGYEGSGLLN